MIEGAEVERLRRDTPNVGTTLHFNNAEQSPSPWPVVNAEQAHRARASGTGGMQQL